MAIQHYTRELKTWLSFTVSTKSHLCAAMLGEKTVFVHNFPFVDMEQEWGNLGQIQILSSMHQNNGLLGLELVLELSLQRFSNCF